MRKFRLGLANGEYFLLFILLQRSVENVYIHLFDYVTFLEIRSLLLFYDTTIYVRLLGMVNSRFVLAIRGLYDKYLTSKVYFQV